MHPNRQFLGLLCQVMSCHASFVFPLGVGNHHLGYVPPGVWGYPRVRAVANQGGLHLNILGARVGLIKAWHVLYCIIMALSL